MTVFTDIDDDNLQKVNLRAQIRNKLVPHQGGEDDPYTPKDPLNLPHMQELWDPTLPGVKENQKYIDTNPGQPFFLTDEMPAIHLEFGGLVSKPQTMDTRDRGMEFDLKVDYFNGNKLGQDSEGNTVRKSYRDDQRWELQEELEKVALMIDNRIYNARIHRIPYILSFIPTAIDFFVGKESDVGGVFGVVQLNYKAMYSVSF